MCLHTGVSTCAHRCITCTQTMSASGARVLMQKHTPKCMHMPLLSRTHTDTALYIHVHIGPGTLACPDRSAHTAHPHIYRHKAARVHTKMASVMYTHAHRTTFKDLYMYIYVAMHVFCTSVQSHRLHTVSVRNHGISQADPCFPALAGWLSLLPSLMTCSSGSCQPRVCPWLPTPRGSQIPD